MMAGEFEGKVIADKYEVDSLIAAGEVGDLYNGRHAFMDKPVTLKLVPSALALDSAVTRRSFNEAKTASRISHPNVLNVTDFGSAEDGTVYCVFEGEGGRTLRQVLDESGRLQVNAAAVVARQSAAGLEAGRSIGIVHGNLSPDNILIRGEVGDDLRVELFGFGSALAVHEGWQEKTPGRAADAYLSPEHFSGESEPDARSDVYALGAVLYEMLAGERPYSDLGVPVGDLADSGGIAADVSLQPEAPAPPLSAFRADVPAEVESVIIKALSADPDLRQQTPGEFAAELDAAVSGQVETASAAAAASGNNIWRTAFIVLAGIGLLSAFLIYATSSRRTDPTTALQPDANGQPVQPINPATGAEEQSLASMPGVLDMTGNTNTMQPGVLPGGDGYNPWATGAPPPGAPPTTYVAPGGQIYTIDPNNPSQFMPADGGVILVPVPANTNAAPAKPTPSPRTPAANANTNTATVPKPTPEAKQAPAKPTPTQRTEKPPANKPQDPEPEPPA